MNPLAWMLLTVIPLGPIRDRVDVIESNVVYCEADESYPLTHKTIFAQIIFREWNDARRMLTSFPVEEACTNCGGSIGTWSGLLRRRRTSKR